MIMANAQTIGVEDSDFSTAEQALKQAVESKDDKAYRFWR